MPFSFTIYLLKCLLYFFQYYLQGYLVKIMFLVHIYHKCPTYSNSQLCIGLFDFWHSSVGKVFDMKWKFINSIWCVKFNSSSSIRRNIVFLKYCMNKASCFLIGEQDRVEGFRSLRIKKYEQHLIHHWSKYRVIYMQKWKISTLTVNSMVFPLGALTVLKYWI